MRMYICLFGLLLSFKSQADTLDVYGAYDVAAPVVNSRTVLTESVAGQVIYDSTDGAFFGLPPGVAPATPSSWVQLSSKAGTNDVTSRGQLALEGAFVTAAGAVTEVGTSDWISGNASYSTGTYVFTLQSGSSAPFSSTPSCTCTLTTTINRFCTIYSASSSSITVKTTDVVNSLVDTEFNFNCIGKK